MSSLSLLLRPDRRGWVSGSRPRVDTVRKVSFEVPLTFLVTYISIYLDPKLRWME